MRVVAGTARGRQLDAPPGSATRPTTDRVRESIFNALGSLDALDGARVLDAFAGSGALGIEALSRGAAHCTFIESDRRTLAVAQRNVDRLGFAGRCDFVLGDALAFAHRFDTDLALCDPPYVFDQWPALLGALRADLVVIESDREITPPAGWETARSRTYGGTVVVFARRVLPQPEGAA